MEIIIKLENVKVKKVKNFIMDCEHDFLPELSGCAADVKINQVAFTI